MKLKFCTALLTVATIVAPLSVMAEKAQDPAAAQRTVAMYGKLPLNFEPTANPARYLAHSGNYEVLVGAHESSVAVTDKKSGKSHMLHFTFDNANQAAPLEAIEQQPGVTNYYVGGDASQWRLGVKSYGKVRANSVYPGVDVVYYGDHRRLEFDFVVAPKADPGVIALSFSGMDKLSKDVSGDLVAEVGGQSVRFAKPYAYQKVDGVSKSVAADYEISANGKVSLQLGNYDRNAALIVDPVVTYATYLGGSAADVANGIAVDKSGNAYVTGQTCSSNFPDNPNPSGDTFSGTCDAYVTEFNSTGTAITFTTIMGGSIPTTATASGNAIALDAAGNIYITGTSNFTDLLWDTNVDYPNPVTGGYPGLNSYQGGDSDAFIVILKPNGTVLQSSYLGGSGADAGYGIAVDQAIPANVIVVGQTCSNNFPGYNAFETKIEFCVAFVTKLDNGLHIGAQPLYDGYASASAMTPLDTFGTPYFFSLTYGGQPVAPPPSATWHPNTYYPLYAIIADNEPSPNIQIVTQAGTSGPSMGTPLPPLVPTYPWNAAPNSTTPDGSIVWTNLGPVARVPTAASQANGVALDPKGDIFVAGGTNTADLAYFPNAEFGPFSEFHGSGAWILKVGSLLGAYKYGAALEANPSNISATINTANAIAVDTSGNAYVTGTASGSIITTPSAYSPAFSGGLSDAFLIKMNNPGSAILYGTYLGGGGSDQGLGVAVDASGAAYVTGSTTSGGTQLPSFPTVNPLVNPNSSPQPNSPVTTLQGSKDAFITKFTTDGSALIFSAYLGGTLTNQGNAIALDTTTTGAINISSAGNMYVAGTTTSVDLTQNLDPATYTPPQANYAAGVNNTSDAFVAMVEGASLPTVTVTPGSLSFGNQGVNVPSAMALIQYKNTVVTTSSSVTISAITFAGANPGDFTQVYPGTGAVGGNGNGDCVPGVVPANVTCNIWVVFTPSGSQGRSATLTITDDYSTTPHVVGLSGTGEYPQDSFSVTSLSFDPNPPYQAIGTPSTLSVTLTNVGLGTLLFSGPPVINGLNPSDFGGPPSTTPLTTTCGAQLAYNASCSFSVTFTPTTSGLRLANLTITDNSPGSPHNISLQGTGAPIVTPTISPLTLIFNNTQPLNVTSPSQTVTVTNNDPAVTLTLATPVPSGNFGVASSGTTCTTSLAPKASCTIAVTFTPTASGALTGTLSVATNAPPSPLVVQLSGTGGVAASGTISLTTTPATTPTSLTFSAQVSSASSTQTVTLTNTGAASLTIPAGGIALTGSGAFVIGTSATNNCPATATTLAAAASCNIAVTFTPPASAGTVTATLAVSGSSANSPQQVNISGITSSTPPPSPLPFSVSPESTGVSVTQGQTATFPMSVAPLNGFNTPITLSCSGPNGSSCSFSMNPVPMDGSTVQTTTLSVNTTGGSGAMANSRVGTRSIFLALLPFSMMGMLLINNKRRGVWLVLVLLGLCLLLGMVACGSGAASSSSGGLTPGTYQITVSASWKGSTGSQTLGTLNLVVNPQ